MSDIGEIIERLQQWADYSEPHYPPEFIADLRALLAAAKAAQQALQVLQGAEEVTATSDEDGGIAVMAYARIVDHAVAILKGECKP